MAANPVPGIGIVKNSGWLRYIFNSNQPAGPGIFPSLGAVPVVIQCMSGHTGGVVVGINSQPDIDGQLFGETPGHAAIVPVAGSYFAVQPLGAFDQEAEGSRGSALAAKRIPKYTKTRALWVTSDPLGLQGGVTVQTEVASSPRRIGGVLEPVTDEVFLASLRVALALTPVQGGLVQEGVLFVEIQHSLLDLPGSRDWAQVSGAVA